MLLYGAAFASQLGQRERVQDERLLPGRGTSLIVFVLASRRILARTSVYGKDRQGVHKVFRPGFSNSDLRWITGLIKTLRLQVFRNATCTHAVRQYMYI